ncbi:MarR family transcriptional regulator [Sulfodiicoccus acidiphilus]|uniref:MarR family transcriptional regulator n=1 Tax=Sulfodiicoccus acidiphilus TaxID=1670455 RepID=A0A348B2Y3_9CREN|nr:MarR family transcriptional regulator [Sulfodiicoccus acidiphilus]BBD72535.1 MarR family transcriptional regulator [Sulfodiicoccus acidiphilus]GGT93853.1 MarR family transcriptional regulator [Sulfodiicoccus acidiphilus]
MSARDRLLDVLSKLIDVRQTDLPRLAGLSKSRVSEVLKELEKEGRVVRAKGPGNTRRVRLAKVLRIGIIRAAEYPFVLPFIKILKEKGLLADLRFYRNGVELTLDLALGKLEVGFSPYITQLILSTVFPNIKLVAGAAHGGGALVGRGDPIGSTSLSSMELWTFLAGKEAVIPAKSAEELERMLLTGTVGAVALWEPFVTKLKRMGYTVEPFELMPCCTMAVSSTVDSDDVKKIYEKAMDSFKSSKERWLSPYAEVLGEDYSLIAEAVSNYVFDPYLDERGLRNKLRTARFYVPGLLGV